MVNHNLLRQYDLSEGELREELNAAFGHQDAEWLPPEHQEFRDNRVVSGHVRKVTGADNGRYGVFLPEPVPYRLHLDAPKGGDYLDQNTEVEVPAGVRESGKNLKLSRGVAASGQVVDHGTGKGIAGVTLAYKPRNPPEPRAPGPVMIDPGVPTAQTGPDGHFRILLPPGKGWLYVDRTAPGYAPRVQLWTTEYKGTELTEGPLVHSVDLQAPQPLTGLRFVLNRGIVLTVKALDPQGKALPGAQVERVSGPYWYCETLPVADEKAGLFSAA
jgi:hypothetical protein